MTLHIQSWETLGRPQVWLLSERFADPRNSCICGSWFFATGSFQTVVGDTVIAIHWRTPGFEGRTFKLYVWTYTDLLQALKGELLNCVYDHTLTHSRLWREKFWTVCMTIHWPIPGLKGRTFEPYIWPYTDLLQAIKGEPSNCMYGHILTYSRL